MKKIILLVASICIMFAGAAYADGTPFEDIISWGVTGQTVFESTGFQYTHEVDFSVCVGDFCDVQLTLQHKGNNSTQNELWFLTDGSDVFIGNLSQSAGVVSTDTFDIGSSFYPALPTSSWSFVVKVVEDVQDGDRDNLVLYSSTLNGNYNCNPVPEPTTLLLLGLGLMGLAGVRRYKN